MSLFANKTRPIEFLNGPVDLGSAPASGAVGCVLAAHLKIIKLGMDTRQVLGRFEAERQALALMDHPNIARILDGGATDTGRPYFVMDLVQGLPITRFCDEANLTTRERLDLFLEVCSAIQHAHQKGIIHRDIKPANILVTLHGDKPVPKVIDFGIAPCRNEEMRREKFDVALPPGW